MPNGLRYVPGVGLGDSITSKVTFGEILNFLGKNPTSRVHALLSFISSKERIIDNLYINTTYVINGIFFDFNIDEIYEPLY